MALPPPPPPPNEPGRTLIYDGLAQNDIDMANHQLLHLDTSNLPPIGIPPSIVLPQNEWLHGWSAEFTSWVHTRPTFVDIGPDNGTLTSAQQSRIIQLGDIRTGSWNATPLAPSKVPRLDLIMLPQDNLNLNSKRITLLADPINPQDAVNLRFMDSLLLGLVPKEAVRVSALTRDPALHDLGILDGVQLVDGDRVLITTYTSTPYKNGIYIASEGNWVRADDADESPELLRAYCTVMEGTENAGKSFVQVNTFANNPPNVGDDVHFILFSVPIAAGGLTAGAGLTIDSGVLNVNGTDGRIAVNADSVDIDPAYIGQSTITTLGAISAGSWFGDVINSAHGGTGVANSGLMTITGNFTVAVALDVSGSRDLSFLLAADTTLTLPTAGTVATKANPETFTNKRITRRVVKIASNAQPSINTDALDVFAITGLSETITSMSTNLTGTPTDRQQLEIWIKPEIGGVGVLHTITWGSKYKASTDLPLPAGVTAGMQMFLFFVWLSESNIWVLVHKLDNIA